MTDEQKWLNKLERLLKKIPDTVELIIEPGHTAHTGTGRVLMVPRGTECATFEQDMMYTDHSEVALGMFYVEAVTGNSEST
tara:strand:+ start:286 stop:528 length:243 start_codon:yes stop_codon:yes gene_type:complete